MTYNKPASYSFCGSLKSVGRRDQDGSDYVITAWLSPLNWYKIDSRVEVYCTGREAGMTGQHFEAFQLIVSLASTAVWLLHALVDKGSGNRGTSVARVNAIVRVR